MSIAQEFGVLRTTLSKRVRNLHLARSEAYQHLQALSPVQEARLAEWVLLQQALGHPPSHGQIRHFADRILALTNPDHPKVGKQIPENRFGPREWGYKVIRPWFNYLAIPAIRAILPENRWNMDEYGLMEGLGSNGLVVGSSEVRATQKKQPGSWNWTSFVECVSATGQFLPTTVIFKGEYVQQQWFPIEKTEYKDWKFTATEKGWTTTSIAHEWLKKVFISRTQPRVPSHKRLLVLDGHDSHTHDDFMWLCFQNNIHCLYLPPHTSHVLQPLDLAVFGPLKGAYRKKISHYSSPTDSSIVGKQNLLICLAAARKEAITAHNIKSGWRASGLWPVCLYAVSHKPTRYSVIQEAIQSNGRLTGVVVSTPRKRSDLRSSMQQAGLDYRGSPTQRLAARKIEKAWDEKNYELAFLKQKVQALEAKVEAMEPTRRRRVRPNPNELFSEVKHVHRA
ncbi:hypothetical protein VTJ04DRAFT_8432 [Mycothermus thermophilus]|uniref:uncharacterized protein n=1 Tax=Humicola insolens TaxID=85995 RepID=UPI00374321EA